VAKYFAECTYMGVRQSTLRRLAMQLWLGIIAAQRFHLAQSNMQKGK
jgi:hypothetical protein